MRIRRWLQLGILACALLLQACQRSPEPRHTVILIDMSASIKQESFDEAINAIRQYAVAAKHGDSIVVIPISGDTDVDTPGRILHFRAPVERQAYDQDLRLFAQNVDDDVAALRAVRHKNPGARTDILGALRIAQQELTGKPRARLVLLSDLLHHDSRLRFDQDRALRDTASAKTAAIKAANETGGTAGGEVRIGLLRSTDYGRLSPERRRAIREFWNVYFAELGTKHELFYELRSTLAGSN